MSMGIIENKDIDIKMSICQLKSFLHTSSHCGAIVLAYFVCENISSTDFPGRYGMQKL